MDMQMGAYRMLYLNNNAYIETGLWLGLQCPPIVAPGAGRLLVTAHFWQRILHINSVFKIKHLF